MSVATSVGAVAPRTPGQPDQRAGCVWSDQELAEVLVRHTVHLQHIAGRVLRGADGEGAIEVEDVLQEAFLRARTTVAAAHLASEERLVAWLATIVYRLAIDTQRRRQSAQRASARLQRECLVTESSAVADYDPANVATNALIVDSLLREAWAVVRRLPFEYRQVLLLRSAMTPAEMAVVLGTTPGAVRARLARARAAYRLAASGAGDYGTIARRASMVAASEPSTTRPDLAAAIQALRPCAPRSRQLMLF